MSDNYQFVLQKGQSRKALRRLMGHVKSFRIQKVNDMIQFPYDLKVFLVRFCKAHSINRTMDNNWIDFLVLIKDDDYSKQLKKYIKSFKKKK